MNDQRASRWRRIFPKSGAHYELFDSSFLLLGVGMLAYVTSTPPATTTQALRAPLRIVTETELGWLMVAAALLGIITSYTPWLRVGYVATITVSMILSINFVLGFLTTGASSRVLASALIYAWIARRLMRDNREAQ